MPVLIEKIKHLSRKNINLGVTNISCNKKLLLICPTKTLFKIWTIQSIYLFCTKKVFYKTKKKADHTQVYTAEELLAIEKLAWEDFYNEVKDYVLCPLAVIFQMETGVRAGELCAVRYEDIEAPIPSTSSGCSREMQGKW